MPDPARRRTDPPRPERPAARKQRRSRRGTVSRADPLEVTIRSYARFLLENVHFGPDDQRTLRAFHEQVAPDLHRIVDDFYRMIMQEEPLRAILGPDPAVLARLRISFRKWLDEILAGPHDRRQIRRHLNIGDKHVEIGLENRFLMLAFQRVRSALLALADGASLADRPAFERSLDRILTFEAALLTDGYARGRLAEIVERGAAEERRFLAREMELIHQVSVAQDRFFSILQNPIALILVVDPKGRVLLFNEAAERTLGYAAAEILGEGTFVDLLVSETDRAIVGQHLARVFAGERVPFLQWGVLTRTGQRLDLASTFFPTSDGTGGPLCAILALDVTEQTRLREELTQAERLATIGRLVAMVAHEVGNPLAGMKGVIEIVRGRLPPGSEETALLDRVLERTNELAELIRDLLVMARPVEVHPVATPVSLFLKDITSGLDPVRDLLGCRIDVVCEPERLAILIDPGQLRRAVMNLLLNAAQAAGSGGSIRLVADVHGDAVWIDVEDSGPGITEAVMRQLFTPFFTTRRGGTGLGLSIAREIVRKHGGELVPANLPEGGARFRIVLPQA